MIGMPGKAPRLAAPPPTRNLFTPDKVALAFVLLLPGIILAGLRPLAALSYFMVLALLEASAAGLVTVLRKQCRWLITPRDFFPVFDRPGLEKFIAHGYDPELGWVRKEGTEKEERGRGGRSTYHIGPAGARSNPGFEGGQELVSTYGDSFVFGRQVNDDQTFQWYLSELTGSKVLNFGVGNYGIDQALLRMKRQFPRTPTGVVIMGVVPSTIVRILCVWKHYNEFGNVFGFKPRFVLNDGKLELVDNFIDSRDKFLRYRDFLNDINRVDWFYERKFKKEMLHFPYLVSLLRRPLDHLPLLATATWDRLAGREAEDGTYPPSMGEIMKRNLRLREGLFLHDAGAIALLGKIVLEYARYVRERGAVPLLLWMPQKDDVLHVRERASYYRGFIEDMKGKLVTVDLTEALLDRRDLEELYSDDTRYGGHFSPDGNRVIAQRLFETLQEENLLQRTADETK